MVDLVPLFLGVLLTVTVAASVEYYRQVRKAQKEYERAKSVVEDIVLSFNRELKRESDRLELVAFKIEGNSAKAESSFKKAESIEKSVTSLENQIGAISLGKSGIATNMNSILSGLTGLESRLKDIEAAQDTLKIKVTGFEQEIQKMAVAPSEIRAEPVITIKRDKAMAALTDTEIAVLEFLSAEGPKTAPEIKEKVQHSREHTARLMKKLYEEGYLEREIGKIPFKYSIKKEMEKLLRKAENTQSI
jgi:chromosome segregation ATPase